MRTGAAPLPLVDPYLTWLAPEKTILAYCILHTVVNSNQQLRILLRVSSSVGSPGHVSTHDIRSEYSAPYDLLIRASQSKLIYSPLSTRLHRRRTESV
jgi:hypothetical protein